MTLLGCKHQPGLISINGMYQCPLCFQQVRHPWAVNPVVREYRTTQEIGIERVARETESVDWPKRTGIKT